MRQPKSPPNALPRHLRLPNRDLIAAGGSVARDGDRVLIDGPLSLTSTLYAHVDELQAVLRPFGRC